MRRCFVLLRSQIKNFLSLAHSPLLLFHRLITLAVRFRVLVCSGSLVFSAVFSRRRLHFFGGEPGDVALRTLTRST
jgi:hypothetical protein